MAIDRWGGSQGLSRISTLRSVGGVIRPGSPLSPRRKPSSSSSRASRKDIKASREEAKKLLAEAGVPNLKFVLWNRNLAMPYTPAGIFLVDQWRQIGVEVEHKQSDTAPYLAHHERRQPRRRDRLLQPVHGRFEPRTCQISLGRRARRRTARARRITELDKLYDDHLRERDPEKRKALIRAFEKRAVRAGLSAAVAVVAPHRADPQGRDGLEDVAEPQSRADLAEVWLNQ